MVKKNEELALLGLARRAGKLIVGAEDSRRAIRRGVARVVVIAEDASEVQRAKVRKAAEARNVPLAHASDRESLGRAIGRGPTTAVAVTDPALAASVSNRLAGDR